jgi:hypothetical protein
LSLNASDKESDYQLNHVSFTLEVNDKPHCLPTLNPNHESPNADKEKATFGYPMIDNFQ